ncbi:hypothetical protein BGZ65_003606 [Modicella reniformis]|uniref:Uncharacterized protein n=1 Tax=Modicella reniformis TaxID=1440133 RepID=A0A9P6SML6_9FUNG|nr:hypothetical protein BGZ65_003606 [Modicella reniformis]
MNTSEFPAVLGETENQPSNTVECVNNKRIQEEAFIHFTQDGSNASALDFMPVSHPLMITQPVETSDYYLAQLVAKDLNSRSRQIGFMNQVLEDQRSRLEQFSKENASIRAQLHQVLDEQTRLREENSRLQFMKVQLVQDTLTRDRVVAETTRRVQDLENERENLAKERIRLEERVRLLKEQCLEAKIALEERTTESIALNFEVRALNDNAKMINETRESIGKELENLGRAFKAIKDEQFVESRALIKENNELKAIRKTEKEAFKKQERDIINCVVEMEAAREQSRALSVQFEASVAEREAIREEKERLESMLKQCQDKNAEMESMLRGSNERYRKANEDVDNIRSSLQEKEKTISTLSKEKDVQTTELLALRANSEVMMNEIQRNIKNQEDARRAREMEELKEVEGFSTVRYRQIYSHKILANTAD